MSNNFYEVKSGDTLWAICKNQFNLASNTDIAQKVAEISKINCIFEGKIFVGQELNLGLLEEKVALDTQEMTKPAKQEEVDTKNSQEDLRLENSESKFVNTIKTLWANAQVFYKYDKCENSENVNLISMQEVEQEEVIPKGYREAPNGKITKIYSQNEIEKIIEDTAIRHRVDSLLVRAIIFTESSNNQFARSKKGAQGLMQLMPNGAGKGLENAYDAKANIERGVQEFARLKRFYGNNEDALRAYNYGEGRYNKYLNGEITRLPKETEDYPVKVLLHYEKLV